MNINIHDPEGPEPRLVKGIEHFWSPAKAMQGGIRRWMLFGLAAIPIIVIFAYVFAAFAINVFSYWGTFLIPAAYAYFLNRRFIGTHTVSVRRALVAGALLSVAFIITSHIIAYSLFKQDLANYLLTQQPGYMDIDWQNPPDTDTLHEHFVRQVSNGELEEGFWTALRIRASAGTQVIVRGTRRSGVGRKVVATWIREGAGIWFLYFLQLSTIIVASLGATLAGASMREVQLEDIHGLVTVASESETGSEDKPDNHAQAVTPADQLSVGQNPDAVDRKPIHQAPAATHRGNENDSLLKALTAENWKQSRRYVRKGAKLNFEHVDDEWLFELLRKVIMDHNQEHLAILIDAGTPIESEVGVNGQTLLMFAAEYSALKCVELLLGLGADVFARDHEGHDLLYHAASWHYERSPQVIKDTQQLLNDAMKDPFRKKKQATPD